MFEYKMYGIGRTGLLLKIVYMLEQGHLSVVHQPVFLLFICVFLCFAYYDKESKETFHLQM